MNKTDHFWLYLLSIPILCLGYNSASAADISDPITVMFVGRAIERLVIVLFAGLSLVLGYRLFYLTEQKDGELFAKGGQYSLKMSRIAPGIFFALFGCCVLGYSLYVAPKASTRDEAGIKVTHLSGAITGVQYARSTGRDYLEALATIQMSIANDATFSDPARRAFIDGLFTKLEPLRRDLTNAVLQPGRYDEWAELNQQKDTNPGSFRAKLEKDQNLARRYNETDLLLSKTFAPQ